MASLAMARDAVFQAFRPGRLWFLQLLTNPILFLLFAGWLLIPVANAWQLTGNVALAVVLVAACFSLHAGTINYYRDFYSGTAAGDKHPRWSDAFRRALRHLLAIAACAVVLWLLWFLLDNLDAYREPLPTFVRSMLPVFLRRHIRLSELDATFGGLLFAARWIVVPGLLLPIVEVAADAGFGGFSRGRGCFWIWKHAVDSLWYWLILAIAAVLGVVAAPKILAWTPDFKTSTLRHEYASLGWRVVAAYLLGLTAWMVVCSLLGCSAAAARSRDDVSRNPRA